MRLNAEESSLDKWFFGGIFILLFVNTIVRNQMPEVRPVGDFTTTACLLIMTAYLIKTLFDRSRNTDVLKRIGIPFVLLFIFYTYGFFTGEYAKGKYAEPAYYVHMMLLLAYILGMARVRWKEVHMRIFGWIAAAATFFYFMCWMIDGFSMNGFKAFYTNQNFLGVLLFCILFFAVLGFLYSRGFGRIIYIPVVLADLAMIVATGSRAVQIGILAALFSWVVLKLFKKKFRYLLYLVFLFTFLFVAVYVALQNTAIGQSLNDLSVEMFGKNLFSGRNQVWAELAGAIADHPFLGHGLGIVAWDVISRSLTAHNFFMQILLEMGIVGMVLYLIVFSGIWGLLNRNIHTAVAKLSACFMIGILVYSTFELTLNQNNYAIAMFQWLIMTMGIGFAKDSVPPEAEPAEHVVSENSEPDSSVPRTRGQRHRTGRR